MRVKSSVTKRKRHKKIHRLAKGYWGARSKWYKLAREAVVRAGCYAYAHRRLRKREFRRLWILRINAALRLHNLTYSTFIHKLVEKNIEINRKILAEMAVSDPEGFKLLIEKVKENA